MSNPDRQRILREVGPRAAEAEKETGAELGKQLKGQEDAELEAAQRPSHDEPTPAAESDDGPPRPRR